MQSGSAAGLSLDALQGLLLVHCPPGQHSCLLASGTLSSSRPHAVQGSKGKVGQGYKFSSVGSRFKKQLQELMDALHQMEPHYIRCIKPNSLNK